ncbi:Retrovirus-related Pol polyprotein [Stylophora pistillata]|uniref:Retrovirus-related Pol polyprotein n=1 Tax=Stylophora pistillata TaxID=50429 RepID=A0A2B4R5G3_STYPI|nr:Retrovirus-related Pol polyprotein [Stylophora pistillata]
MDAKKSVHARPCEKFSRISVAISVTSLTLVTLLFMRIELVHMNSKALETSLENRIRRIDGDLKTNIERIVTKKLKFYETALTTRSKERSDVIFGTITLQQVRQEIDNKFNHSCRITSKICQAGPPGPRGAHGYPGYKGEKGAVGKTGPRGPQGPIGAPGSSGKRGPVGPQGAKGDKGDKGSVGATGIRGETGSKGRQGQKGSIGLKGNRGSRGLVGIQGPKGECVVPPKISVHPVSQQVFVNEPAIFYCWVQGQMSSKITWRKLGGSLSGATVEDGALQINSVQRSHVGSYMCTAHTGLGLFRIICRLQVKGLGRSAILAKNENHLEKLRNWLSSVEQTKTSYWKRCWRASVDGWLSTTFHSLCDNKGPTITIIRVGRYIFGGYTSTSWIFLSSGRNIYICLITGGPDKRRVWLFIRNIKEGWGPRKLLQTGKYSSKRYSIYSCSSHGPRFGGGADINLVNPTSSSSNSNSNLGYTFQSPSSRHGYSSSFAKSFLAGSYYFRPDEIEVFYETSAFPHAGGKEKCPAWGKKCTTCGKLNHFAKCCRSKRKVNESIVKTVRQEVQSDSSDAESLCGIEEVGAVESNTKPKPVRSIKIENHVVKGLIDTGASVNVMDECTFQQLLANKIKLEESTSVLRSYQTNENPSRPLTVMGKFDAVVESNTRIIPATFHVFKGNTNMEPLIGFQTAESLGLVVITNAIRTDSEMFTGKLLEEYTDLFPGIGKMEGVQVDLHVDRTVTPVAQPHWRIPFIVRPKLEAELERLIRDDVIEKVEEPTSWVSPVVITPKRTANEIRLNVDMREANKAIPRTHTIMPTLEDITHELNGATFFSHLDKNNGYHQLELQENSRDITTFSTHIGLYRYKRLNSGTRSAGEIFQDTVSREITRNIPGCLNISADILVYGKTQQEHDRNLDKLFKKAREKKITFNKGKCEFNKQSCVYYGMKFSKDGASPDPRKVEAIKAAEPPRNAKELNSFLCTVQYNARFMEKYAPQTDLLRGLLKANVFAWTRNHQEAFESLKEGLSSDTVLVYFDPAAEHEVHVDGCPLGISATLVQRESSDKGWRVVQYASRALSDAERNYSQIELEMLDAQGTDNRAIGTPEISTSQNVHVGNNLQRLQASLKKREEV